MQQIEKIQQAYNHVNKDTLDFLDTFYSENIEFVDPLGRHKGIDEVKGYYKKMYKNVQEIRFDFTETVSEGSKHVLFWNMHVQAKGLNGGEKLTVEGCSIMKADEDGRIFYHRDFFDMGEMVYEKLPVLKWIVGGVKKAMKT